MTQPTDNEDEEDDLDAALTDLQVKPFITLTDFYKLILLSL